MHGIAIHCGHSALAGDLRTWLAGAPLLAANDVELFVHVGSVPVLAPDARPIFRQGRVAIRGGTTSDPTLTLEWGPGLGIAFIEPTCATADAIVSEEGLNQGHELFRSFFLNVCILILRRAGLHHVHGASLIDPHDRGWMFVGASGSGKSTTTALLARRGWQVGTDDIAFLSRAEDKGVHVRAWHDHVALRADSANSLAVEGGVTFDSRKKTGWLPESLGATWAPSVRPTVLAFTELDAERPTTMTPLAPREALHKLLHNSAWVMLDALVADEHLSLLTTLAQQTQAYELRLGRDMFAHPERLSELVA